MPIFQYQCQCGEQFEKIMPIALRHEAHCPDCGRLAIKKISGFNFSFGWRLTRKEEFDKLGKDDLVRNV